ncbi:MAG TPA: response regulator [Bacteroidia bacterium]|nr:response regulator [Bacteroidia bacterium]
MKVLIVDDVKEITVHMDEIVRSRFPDARTEHALTAEEAMIKFESFSPNFILLDINLGQESGLTVLKHVREKTARTKIIMVSNFNDEVHKKICLVLGADSFVDKTKEFHLIPEIIATHLKND